MDLDLDYSKGKIIIYPPKEFDDLENPFIDNPKLFRRFMVEIFRAVFYYFREKAYKKARVSFGKYKCNVDEDVYMRKETAADHIQPIVSLNEKENDWNGIIPRCFDLNNVQIISNIEHKKKTALENSKRFKGRKKDVLEKTR